MSKVKITGLDDRHDRMSYEDVPQLRAVHVVEEQGDRERTLCGIDLVSGAKSHSTDARVSCIRCRNALYAYHQVKLGKG